MDWITLCIEAVGAAILCIWIVIPINEFKEILAKVRPHGNHDADHPAHADQPDPADHREGRDAQ